MDDKGATSRFLPPILLVIPALWTMHQGLLGRGYLGLETGEVWGRLFVTGQVGRWLGQAPPGWADLLSAPHGQRFWPVDPILQLLAVPLVSLTGEAVAWALILAGLAWLAGVGGWFLARTAGAGPWSALAGGALLQLSPFWLRNAADGVTETLATGPLALAAAFALLVARGEGRRAWRGFGLSVVLLTGLSPYYALYGALGLALSLPLWPRHAWRRGAALLGLAAGVGLVFLLPMAWAEAGPGGRLSAAWEGGYRLLPEPLVRISPTRELIPVSVARLGGGEPGGVALWHRTLVQWPGGIGVLAALLAGLSLPRWRRAAGLGLGLLLLGPGWSVLGRWLTGMDLTSPLQWLLLQLPVTRVLGNDERMVVLPLVCAALLVGPLARRWRGWAPTLAILALAAGMLEVPPLRLPVVPMTAPTSLWEAIEGPTITWPSGDPPLWNPGQPPKLGLWLAAQHGGPQAYDYGRGAFPTDAPLQVRLSQVAGVPLGRRAAELGLRTDDEVLWSELREAGFTRVLVLTRGLEPGQVQRAWTWLGQELGEPLAQEPGGAVWSL